VIWETQVSVVKTFVIRGKMALWSDIDRKDSAFAIKMSTLNIHIKNFNVVKSKKYIIFGMNMDLWSSKQIA
jgi:hypothetical protein